jgi:hypothetical protein
MCPDREWISAVSRALQERYETEQAINLWKGPKFPEYSSFVDRARSFEDAEWPEDNPTPVAMAEAGFYFNSRYKKDYQF